MTLVSTRTEFVATFVAGQGATVDDALIDSICANARVGDARRAWLAPKIAVDVLFFDESIALPDRRATFHDVLGRHPVDIIVQPAAGRRKQLLVSDMDSTMIEQECIDELADMVGLRAPIAAITERAMRGELVFEEALIERVKLLAGVRLAPVDDLIKRITLAPGARTLVQTMRAHRAYTALVTGGFAQFAAPVGERIGFDETFANHLEIKGEALTGVVLAPIQGRAGKRVALVALRDKLGLAHDATLAIGDGANDLDMLCEAGLGVAYHAKPKVAEAADARIAHADLTALLYAQGYRREEFVA